MDFVKILRSLEEFLYEVMSWLAFYPRTLLRIVARPVAVSRYTVQEMAQEQDRRFTETISPPLMLILSLLLAHGVEMIVAPPLAFPHNAAADLVFGTEQGLLLFRCVSFSLYALIAALWTMARTRQPLDRDTLRGPFYVQCFLASPFALFVSLSLMAARLETGWGAAAGASGAIATVLWYLWARASVYRHFSGAGMPRALATAGVNFLIATALVCCVTLALLHAGPGSA